MHGGLARFSSWAGLALALAALNGCSGNADVSDLRQFIAEVDARPAGTIEPLPEFKPYEAFAYSAASMRSPFEPPVQVKPINPDAPRSNVKPDPNRVPQYLEQFNIGELRMVGTLSRDDVLYGLIQDPNGGVHRVRPGDYMGTDYGRIVAVTETQIDLVEIVSDGQDGWLERARSVELSGEG